MIGALIRSNNYTAKCYATIAKANHHCVQVNQLLNTIKNSLKTVTFKNNNLLLTQSFLLSKYVKSRYS